MQADVIAYDLLLSYPSDLKELTPLIKGALTEFNNHYGREHGLVIRPIHWQDDAYPTFESSAQVAINKQIADSCDILLACFWTRFGSPTEGYGSGTEEEIERARLSGRQVFLYFLEKPVSPSMLNPAQYQAIADFRKRCKSESLYFTVEDEHRLVSDFRQKLELFFAAELKKTALVQSTTNKRILWVDDRPQNNVYVREIMENYGLEFSLALSTSEALRLLKHESYRLVISDMGRREGPREGYVLLDTLRKEGNSTPLIFFAASRDPEHVAETLHHGGQGCTNDGAELIDMVIRVILGDS